MCLWIFACPDGGRRPPAGGPLSGVEPCGLIRGIREIRGDDQPPLRTHDCPAGCQKVVVPLELPASAVCTRGSSMS